MAVKDPQQFEVGDTIKNVPGTPYSGSKIVEVEGMGDGRTQVAFENGELVEFYNGIQHEMQE